MTSEANHSQLRNDLHQVICADFDWFKKMHKEDDFDEYCEWLKTTLGGYIDAQKEMHKKLNY